jgi:hypothetical protein
VYKLKGKGASEKGGELSEGKDREREGGKLERE